MLIFVKKVKFNLNDGNDFIPFPVMSVMLINNVRNIKQVLKGDFSCMCMEILSNIDGKLTININNNQHATTFDIRLLSN